MQKYDIYFEAWLESILEEGKSAHTIQAYGRGFRHFAEWYEQAYDDVLVLHRVTPRDIRNWKIYQQTAEGAAPTTINQRLVAVNRFFKWARRQKICTENPAEGVLALRLVPLQLQSLSSADLRRFVRQAYANPRDYAMIEVLVGTGVRGAELLSLTIADIDLSEHSARLRVRHAKPGSSRQIPLTKNVCQALARYLDVAHPNPNDPQMPLWFNTEGKRLQHRSSITRILNKYAEMAGLERVTAHRLRHTFATNYLKVNPDDFRGLAQLLGYTNFESVMVYIEPQLEDFSIIWNQ